jgi:hypothetical protein
VDGLLILLDHSTDSVDENLPRALRQLISDLGKTVDMHQRDGILFSCLMKGEENPSLGRRSF